MRDAKVSFTFDRDLKVYRDASATRWSATPDRLPRDDCLGCEEHAKGRILMYGTVARLQLKPGAEASLKDELDKYSGLKIPGFVSTMVYRMDADANECYLAVAFEDKHSYHANAEDPKQDERYRRMRALLTADPEWHDGEIVWSEKA